jgi:hypothetical protein
MNNLANAYDRQGKHRDAEVLYKQCLDKQKALLGESHPDTLGAMNNLAGMVVKLSIEKLRSCTSSA